MGPVAQRVTMEAILGPKTADCGPAYIRFATAERNAGGLWGGMRPAERGPAACCCGCLLFSTDPPKGGKGGLDRCYGDTGRPEDRLLPTLVHLTSPRHGATGHIPGPLPTPFPDHIRAS